MIIFIILISLIIFLKTVNYGIFEWKENSNKSGAIAIFIVALVALIAPTTVFFIQ